MRRSRPRHSVGRLPWALGWTLALLPLYAAPSFAQEATNTPAATQPAQGNFYFRQKFQSIRLGPMASQEIRGIDEYLSTSMLAYGLRRDLSLSLEVPLALTTDRVFSGTGNELGLRDPSLALKWRPLQFDLGPIDSVRLAFFGGLEAPLGDARFSSRSWDPFAGVVFTAILGRHGFNQALAYKFNTSNRFSTSRADGPGDALRYDTAYLFRLAPARYGADTRAATYLTMELNGLYETGGDNEILVGPGLLYEARSFALEATAGFPVDRSVSKRPRTEMVLTLGFRILF